MSAQQAIETNRMATQLFGQGRIPEAIAAAREAVRLAQQHMGHDHPDTATMLRNVGYLLKVSGDLSAARPFIEEALAIHLRALGENHATTAMSFNNLAALFLDEGKGEQARPLYERALAIRLRVLGLNHPDTAASYNNLAALLADQGERELAREHHERALQIRRAVLGERHSDTAQSMNNLGGFLLTLGEDQEARPYLESAVSVYLETLGENHPETARALGNLGEVLKRLGERQPAQKHLERALQITETVLGENHLETARALTNLGTLLADRDWSAARYYLDRGLEIRRRLLGEDHSDTVTSSQNLSSVLLHLGEYSAARPLCERVLQIARRDHGEDSLEYASALSDMGVLHQHAQEFESARRCHEQALTIRRRLQGEDDKDTQATLNNLGMLHRALGEHAIARRYLDQAATVAKEPHPIWLANLAKILSDQGDLEAARRCLEQALQLFRQVDEDHPHTAIVLNDMGALWCDLGDYGEARSCYDRALNIHLRQLGREHPETAAIWNNLGTLLSRQGDLESARACYHNALVAMRSGQSEDGLRCAKPLLNLGILDLDRGEYESAQPTLQRALSLLQDSLGDRHPDTALALLMLARLHAACGRIEQARDLMTQVELTQDEFLAQVSSVSSARERTLFLQDIRGRWCQELTLTARMQPPAVARAFDLVLRRKGFAAEILAVQRDAVLRGRHPHLAPLMSEIAALRLQIARKTLAGPGSEAIETHRSTLAEWDTRIQTLERELVRQIPEMAGDTRHASREAIAAALPEGSALLEFVQFDVADFQGTNRQYWKPACYVAFVLPAGRPDALQMFDLGDARALDEKVTAFLGQVGVAPALRSARALRPLAPVKAAPAAAPADPAIALAAALLGPILSVLADYHRLVIAPDGQLNLVPFELLPMPEGTPLAQTHRVSYVGCGRDVLRFTATSSHEPAAAVVVADPDFDLRRPAPELPPSQAKGGIWSMLAGWAFGRQATPSVPERAIAGTTTGPVSRDLSRNAIDFSPLPGTRIEGERIAAMLGVVPWLQADALESRLKQHRSPRILHLATHGFFLPDQNLTPADPNAPQRQTGPAPENPLLRCGLALAGAATWLRGGAVPEAAEDGLLTAEDVTGLDLLDTELVVLSACETGLGVVQTGEGVLGLRRSFILAGARTVIFSLWKVPDLPTALLMGYFYENLLVRRLPRDEALRQARFFVRDLSVGRMRAEWLSAEAIARHAAGNEAMRRELEELSRQPDGHRPFADAYHWGAFVCQGDPGALR